MLPVLPYLRVACHLSVMYKHLPEGMSDSLNILSFRASITQALPFYQWFEGVYATYNGTISPVVKPHKDGPRPARKLTFLIQCYFSVLVESRQDRVSATRTGTALQLVPSRYFCAC